MVYALITAALVFWLRNILGTKSGEDSHIPIVKKEFIQIESSEF